MPIRAQLRPFYGRAWRTEVRPRILLRARRRCEQCGAPNGVPVFRIGGAWLSQIICGIGRYRLVWIDPDGRRLKKAPPGPARIVRIVITIAHLDHVAGHDDDDNLRALCQWCHLHYDLEHHHETRAARKDAARPLLARAARMEVS